MDPTTHASLLTRVSAGVDPAAWREFHDRYAELIRRFARRRGMQPSDCDDVTQEVLLSLSKSMGRFRYDPTRGKFRSYLKTLTLHAIVRNQRQKPEPEALEVVEEEVKRHGEDPAVEAYWEDEWRQYHIRRAMRRIEGEFNALDRKAFSLYAMKGRPAGDTAAALGLTVDQVYQAKSRILRRLSEMIAEQVDEED